MLASVVRPAWADTDLAWGLPELMAGLARVKSGSAQFVERHYLQVTTQPLVSTGVLRYAAPDRLEKQTLAPQPGRLSIEGDRLLVEQAGSPGRSLSLREVPEISALVDGLRATMAGDLATLNRVYTLALRGGAADWQLDLVPRERRMLALVSGIRITGSFDLLRRIDTYQPDGDHSDMTITPDPS